MIYSLNQVGKEFGEGRHRSVAVRNVTLQISPGEQISLIGPSGAGKTTLFRLMNGSLFPSSGTLLYRESDLAATSYRQLREMRRRIGSIYQQHYLVTGMSVLANTLSGALGRWGIATTLRNLASPSALEVERAERCLEAVGLADKTRCCPPVAVHSRSQEKLRMAQSLAKRAPAFADTKGGSIGAWRLPAALAVLLLWAAWNSGIDLRLLFLRQTWAALFDFLQRLFPPDLSLSFLGTALRATWMTFATAVIATAASSLIALPLGILASGRLWRRGINAANGKPRAGSWMGPASWIVLHGMGVVRSIPDLVWALLFVAGIGLGPTAGTLALAVSYTALLGRVYADIFDETDVRPLEALEALGATRMQVFLFGILPQSRALLTSYTLYSFECSVRSAAVLGFVGAGGLGYEISLSMRLFEFPQVLTLMACFVLLVFGVDLASRGLRARLKANPETSPDPAVGGVFRQDLRRRWLIGLLAATILLLSLSPAGITPASLLQSDTARNLVHFARQLLSPEISPSFLREVTRLALQTISISVIGTASGAALGLLLALPATRLRAARHESLDRSRKRVNRGASAGKWFWSSARTG